MKASQHPRTSLEPVNRQMEASSYLIIGAGVFGASTAYHLIRQYPQAEIHLIDRADFPCQVAASWDWCKVIRADYTNILYMEKALEALEVWRNDPLFNQFYHESGLVYLSDSGLPEKIVANYKALGATEKARTTGVEEVKKSWDGVLANADFTDVQSALINRGSGWAEATKALKRITEVAIEAGVQYTAADIASLTFNGEGACTGVRTSLGEKYTADHIVLATGAYTAKLLADSAPDRPELQTGNRVIAVGVCNAMFHLTSEQRQQFGNSPVLVNPADTTCGRL